MNDLQKYDDELLKTSSYLLGVDEAGRGCLAGPVTAGACVMTSKLFESNSAVELSARINDSKQLSALMREQQFDILKQLKADGFIDFAVAEGSVQEIAEFNILGATRLAMQRAVDELASRAQGWRLQTVYDDPLFEAERAGSSRSPESNRHLGEASIIVDGRPLKPFPYAHQAVVKGDGKSLAIAMASIAAKVSRDQTMKTLSELYPLYGFEQHKGYGTKQHRDALKAHGPTPVHRALFLRKVL